uniref:Uncharacterized protein n=1 Tax=Romanomermis culicivorax TaxID=13658 RepID=A0A915JZF4_ROMCU
MNKDTEDKVWFRILSKCFKQCAQQSYDLVQSKEEYKMLRKSRWETKGCKSGLWYELCSTWVTGHCRRIGVIERLLTAELLETRNSASVLIHWENDKTILECGAAV